MTSKEQRFSLPFNGEWLAFWAGDTNELNQHHGNTAQNYAFDFVVVDDKGKFYKTDGETTEDYYSFGKQILCPSYGTVVEVVDGVRDNKPKDTNPYSILGNYIIIRHPNNTYSVLSHLKQNSITVKPGDSLHLGDSIGRCGNSGQSSDPHLHYHVQDSDIFARLDMNYRKIDIAKGVKISFSDIQLNNSSGKSFKSSYSPVKGDIVSNQR